MNKLIRGIIVYFLTLSLVLSSLPAFAAGPNNTPDYAPDHILVQFKLGVSAADRQAVYNRLGGQESKAITQLDVDVIKIQSRTVSQMIAAYKNDPSVAFAEPDFVVKAIGTPNDPYFNLQWGPTRIQAPQAWDVTTGNSSVKIAILDTGIDQDHEDLAAKITANQNFSTSTTVDDMVGHGTHVAGIAAAITNNGRGIAGIGYSSSLMNGKVLDDSGSGFASWVASGITWAADNGAKVINMSLGGPTASSTLENAVNYAWNKGVVVVAAAGNTGDNSPSYPAYYANCISVAATDQNDLKASFSTYGTWVDVAAPGVNIFSTLPNHPNSIGTNYGYLSGTSMATPFVSGLAALVWSTSYGTSANSVRHRIESTADAVSGTGTYWQNGRINAYQAVIIPPAVTTNIATNITLNSATLNGNLDNKGTSTSANVSFQWGTSTGNYPYETPAQTLTAAGPFSANLNNLTANTTYYYRGKAVGNGTVYGQELTFTTKVQTRTVTLAPNVVNPGDNVSITANLYQLPGLNKMITAGLPVVFNYVTFKLQSGTNQTGSATVNTDVSGNATLSLPAPMEKSVILADAVFNGSGNLLASSNMKIVSAIPIIEARLTATSVSGNITFHLADQFSNPLSGQTLSYLSTSGNLTTASGVTNLNGDVSVVLSGTSSAVVSGSFGGFINAQGWAYQPTLARITVYTVNTSNIQTRILNSAPNVINPGDNVSLTASVYQVPGLTKVTTAGLPLTFNYVIYKLQSGTNQSNSTTVTTNANGNAVLNLVAPMEKSVILVDSVFNGSGNLLASSNMKIISAVPIICATITANSNAGAITFHLADQFGNALAGQTLSFLTTAGTLSTASGATNATGDITVTLSGATSAVVSASFGGYINAAGWAYQPALTRIGL